jgi:hypothetical protein
MGPDSQSRMGFCGLFLFAFPFFLFFFVFFFVVGLIVFFSTGWFEWCSIQTRRIATTPAISCGRIVRLFDRKSQRVDD